MANTFVYHGDPGPRLDGDVPVHVELQLDAGVSLVTTGRPWTTDEFRSDPSPGAQRARFARIRDELEAMAPLTHLPLRAHLPSPELAGVPPGPFAAEVGALIAARLRCVEVDGRAYAVEGSGAIDGEWLKSLERPRGMVTGVHLGAARNWSNERLAHVCSGLSADRYVLDFAEDEDHLFKLLGRFPDGCFVVLGLVLPSAEQDNEALLERIDRAGAFKGAEELSLTIVDGFPPDSDMDVQRRKVMQLIDVSNMYWGFAT